MAAHDAAAKQRIIKHMNDDHRDSVQRYVEYYNNVSRFASRSATLKDIQLEKLVITAGGKDFTIPLDPPMSSFKDARERVVEMDRTAVAGLGRSNFTIKEYRPPKGFHAVVFAASLGTFILFARKANLEPGSYLHEILPSFASFCARIRNIMGLVVLVHVSEAVYMTTVMRRHSVPLLSGLWFKWVISNLIEGAGAYQRINAMAKENGRHKENEKH